MQARNDGVTLVKLSLQALHLSLVPADSIDAFSTQTWEQKQKQIIRKSNHQLQMST